MTGFRRPEGTGGDESLRCGIDQNLRKATGREE
jgi:hypothetical protein